MTQDTLPEIAIDPVESARAAGLRYVSDQRPGIRRRRAGKGFTYVDAKGERVADEKTLARIKSLAIPPAWSDVWICPRPNGHIQATGRDAKGRKQYRYHPRWREVRDETKYARLLAFGAALPKIRARVDEDLSRRALTRTKVLAIVVRLLETTLIRVGNEEYARANHSYGLTTLRNRHVKVEGSKLHFHFQGKSGVKHDIEVRDRRLARLVRRIRALPGQEVFQYLDEEGKRQTIDSGDVNDYLQEITGEPFTAKDFRTWAGTVLAAMALQEYDGDVSATQAKKNVVRAVEAVAERLGNTPSICRKCYVHPAVIDAYLDGTLLETLRQRVDAELEEDGALDPDERAVLRLLQSRLQAEVQAAAS